MNDTLSEDVHSLVIALCEGIFGEGADVAVTPGASTSSGLWARVGITGAWSGEVWVGTSRALLLRIASRVFSEVDSPLSLRDLEDTSRELANIVAGNLKALFPPPSRLGLPEVCPIQPRDEAHHSHVRLSVDGDLLEVLVRPTASALG
jgi:hypothetical protein